MKAREYWLDYLRAFACILVTLGHLIMSFQESFIIKDELIFSTFVKLIYCFHVYIFFFCSGYLLQASKTQTYKLTARIEKCTNFLILYVIFSGITYVIKTMLSSEVNSAVDQSFLDVLIKNPVNQMWYLYAISAIFLFAFIICSDKSAYLILGVALVLKIAISIPSVHAFIPIPISYVFQNMIWFSLGQFFAYKKIKLDLKMSLLSLILFASLFALKVWLNRDIEALNAVLTLLGIMASVGIVYGLTKNKTSIAGVWKYLSKYMLQIYLLHTIFAAAIRIVLFKLGVYALVPHLIAGVVFSFVLPIVCAIIAERIKFFNIVFFPTKTVKEIFFKNKTK